MLEQCDAYSRLVFFVVARAVPRLTVLGLDYPYRCLMNINAYLCSYAVIRPRVSFVVARAMLKLTLVGKDYP